MRTTSKHPLLCPVPCSLYALVCLAGTTLGQGPPPVALPAVVAPPQNQITEAKRILGKVLFWDEQLGTSNAMSCGTCHMPSKGGGDARRVRTPGLDAILNNADDKFGSPGIVASDNFNEFRRSATFNLAAQVTPRSAPSMVDAAFAGLLFWDGRASGPFRDPATNAVVSPNGAALEIQALGPILSDREMAHDARTWDQVASKLASSAPLALARNIPPDVAAVLADGSNYPILFARAFGTGAITGTRIAQALATYQRTLISNQTPFDLWAAGNATALTPNQRQGWAIFNSPQASCAVCHAAPTFAGPNTSFHNIGLRPAAEDLGRQIVTGNPANRGQMKTPTLRNTGLRSSWMHTGQFTNLNDVLAFYAHAPGSPVQIQDNLSPPLQNVAFNPQQAAQMVDFLTNALTDPRVRNETFPFDRPQLWSEQAATRPTSVGGSLAVPGAGVPTIFIIDPALIGGQAMRIGLADAPTGAVAVLRVSTLPPVNGLIAAEKIVGPAINDADGVLTRKLDFTAGTTPNAPVYVQWIITTAQGTGRSDALRVVPICPSGGCPSTCPADTAGPGQSATPDGQLTADDIIVFLNRFFAAAPRADIAGPGQTSVPDAEFTADDIILYLNRFFSGC